MSRAVVDPLAPFEAAGRFWEHSLSWPWQTVGAAIGLALEAPAENALVWLNLAAALTALVASIWAVWRGPRAWGIWGLALLTLYLCLPGEEPLKSILRYGLPVVPVWLLMARWARWPVLEGVLVGLLANTDPPLEMRPGASVGHLQQILEALARLQAAPSVPLLPWLLGAAPRGTTAILAVSDLAPDLERSLHGLMEAGCRVLPILASSGTTRTMAPEWAQALRLTPDSDLSAVLEGAGG